MEELMEDREFQKKIARVPPHLRETFIAIMQKMCQRESEILLDFIGQSRDDMTRQANEIGTEQTKLKTHAQDLEEKRKKAEEKAMTDYLLKRGKNGTNVEKTLNPEMKNTPLMDLYFRQKARRKARKRGEEVSESDDEFDVTAAGSRMSTVASTQSIPTPVVVKTIEELRDELFQNLNTADSKMQEERQRQTELLDFLKDVKSKKKSDKAQALLSEAIHSEQVIAEMKEQQDRKVKEKLEERKKKKHRHRSSRKRRSVINLEDGGGVSENGGGVSENGSEMSSVDESVSSKKRGSKKDRRRKKIAMQMENTSEMLNDELHIEDETKVGKKEGRCRKSRNRVVEDESAV